LKCLYLCGNKRSTKLKKTIYLNKHAYKLDCQPYLLTKSLVIKRKHVQLKHLVYFLKIAFKFLNLHI